MPRKDYIIILNDKTRIIVFYETNKGEVVKFVVKLEVFYNNQWTEVERFDTHHGYVHKDILNREGKKLRFVKYELMNVESGLNMAIKDFKENFEIYIWRFFNG